MPVSAVICDLSLS